MFPFDSLSCEIVLESYSFNTDEVRLLWHDVPITMMEKVSKRIFPVGYLIRAGFELKALLLG